MKRRVYVLTLLLTLLIQSHLIVGCYAWGNGGYSSSPSAPKYGTHDWIAEHALDWLPSEAKQWITANLNLYLYGTELPDNGRAPDGIGDTGLHHIYLSAGGALVDDAAARRANETFSQALALMLSGDFASAAKYAGAMTHYIADMAVFGHVMGSGTDWGAELHHSDYEEYVGKKTSWYYSEWSAYLSFDGDLRLITAYDAAVELAYDTTFDRSGRGLTCVWMDENYNWSNPIFVARALESLNLAVNYITDVLYTLYTTYVAQTTKPVATVTFFANGINSDAGEAVLTVDGVSFFYSQLPASFTWEVGSSHSFEWKSPIGAGSGKQYVWVSTSGLSTARSGTINVPSGGGSVTAAYKTEYYLTMQPNPPEGGSVSPASGWYDAGSSVTISASPASGWAFEQWVGSGSGSYSGTSSSATITVSGPITETAYFYTFSMSVSPSSGSVQQGGNVSSEITVTLTGGYSSSITVSLSASGLPSGASADFTPSFVIISPSNPSATSTMTIMTSSSTPAGTYTVTITGSGGGLSKTTTYTLTVNPAVYTISFQILDDAGNAVSGATLVFDGASYSHGDSVSKPAGSYSLSVGTIPSGHRFSQWQASGSITISSPSSSSTTVTVSGSGSITMRLQRTATVTFSVSGMGSDASGTVLTVDGTSYSYSSLPVTFTWDVGSQHSFTWTEYVSAGSGKRYTWVSTNGLSTSRTGTINVPSGGGSVQATYKTEYRWTFEASGLSSDASGTVVTVDGTNYGYSSLPLYFWWDNGSTHSYSYQQYVLTSNSGKRYANHNPPSWSGTVTGPGSLNPAYHVEYRLTVSVSPSGAGTISPAPGDYWYDSGSSVSVSATANAGYAFSHWLLDGSNAGSSNPISVTMDAPHTLTAVFTGASYTLTVYVYKSGTSMGIQGVTVKIDGVSYITDYSGSVSVQVALGSHVVEVESPFQSSSGVKYTFIGWSDGSTSNPRTIVVSSDTIVAAYMETMPDGAPSGGGQTVAVTFTASGLENPSPAKPILVVDNQFYGANQLPITFMWDVGSTHGYSWAEMVESTSEDTRFRLAFVTGLSDKFLGFITVPPEGGFVEAIYKTQYRVGIGAEAGKGTTEPSPGIYWFDAGTRVNVTAIPGPKYEFKMWRAIMAAGAAYDRYSNPTTIWLDGPIDIVAEFTEAFDYQITLTPSSISLYRGKSADISVQVERTAGEARQEIKLSLAGAPSGVSYRFNVKSGYPPLYATLTIIASNDAPIGTHILTIRALYGETVKEAPLPVIIMEPEKAWYEQPWTLAAVALTVIVAVAIIIRRRRA